MLSPGFQHVRNGDFLSDFEDDDDNDYKYGKDNHDKDCNNKVDQNKDKKKIEEEKIVFALSSAHFEMLSGPLMQDF